MDAMVGVDASREGKIPLTVLTGFLGSGKTTLLRYILDNTGHGKRIAVVENEFATELGVKNELREEMSHAACVAELFETASGCLCCDGSEDFKRIMKTLVSHRDRFDYIILETTGLVDPAFVQLFFLDPDISKHVYLDGIVTMVDAKHIRSQLQRTESREQADDPSKSVKQVLNEAYEQLLIADRVIVNKADLVTPEEVQGIRDVIGAINPFLSKHTLVSEYAKVPLEEVIAIKAFDLTAHLQTDEGLLDPRPYRKHDVGISSMQLRGKGVYDREDLDEYLGLFYTRFGKSVMRTKGIFHVREDKEVQRFILQGVHEMYELQRLEVEDGDDSNKLVLIGVDMDPVDVLQQYENHFSAGPKMWIDSKQSMGKREAPGQHLAQYGTVVMLLVVLLISSGQITTTTWTGVATGLTVVVILGLWVTAAVLGPQ